MKESIKIKGCNNVKKYKWEEVWTRGIIWMKGSTELSTKRRDDRPVN